MDGSDQLVLEGDMGGVRRARRFAREQIDGMDVDPDAVDLVVTELVANALLHGAPPITVRVSRVENGLRIVVADSSNQLPVTGQPGAGSMTGRGLGIVTALTTRWEVNPLPQGGKVISADLAALTNPGETPRSATAVAAAPVGRTGPPPAPSGPLFTVRLPAVPTKLLMEAKAHIDNLVREFTLARESATFGAPLSGPMSALVSTVTKEFAEARGEIKRQALAAARRGETVTELVLRLPVSAADSAEAYLSALDEADRYARAEQLLTLATPPTHRAFRRWYLCSLVEQLRAQARGEQPPPTPPLAEAMAHQMEETNEKFAVRPVWEEP